MAWSSVIARALLRSLRQWREHFHRFSESEKSGLGFFWREANWFLNRVKQATRHRKGERFGDGVDLV